MLVSRDFYESWRLIRKVYEDKIYENAKLKEVAEILDTALLKYIIADQSPNCMHARKDAQASSERHEEKIVFLSF